MLRLLWPSMRARCLYGAAKGHGWSRQQLAIDRGASGAAGEHDRTQVGVRMLETNDEWAVVCRGLSLRHHAVGRYQAFCDPTGRESRMNSLTNLQRVRSTASRTGERARIMIASIGNYVVYAWNFIFNHEVSPLRNIPDVGTRHYALQVLGVMWAVSFSTAIGSYTFLAASVFGHTVLIAAAAITVVTLTAAAKKPQLFVRGSGRRFDGEHE